MKRSKKKTILTSRSEETTNTMVWIMPKTRTVLVTDDPGVPINACYIKDKEPPEWGGTYQEFADSAEACQFARDEAKRLNYHLSESWIWNVWGDEEDYEDDDYDY